MKTTQIVLLSGLLLCGCTQKQAVSVPRAIDLLGTRTSTKWSDGYTVNIGKRDGASLEQILVVHVGPNGDVTQASADRGMVSPGSDEDYVTVMLKDAKIFKAATNVVVPAPVEIKDVTFVLHK